MKRKAENLPWLQKHTPTHPQKKLGWQNQCQTKEIAKPFPRLFLDCHDKGLNQVPTDNSRDKPPAGRIMQQGRHWHVRGLIFAEKEFTSGKSFINPPVRGFFVMNSFFLCRTLIFCHGAKVKIGFLWETKKTKNQIFILERFFFLSSFAA